MNRRTIQEIDRWVTGNYGEDNMKHKASGPSPCCNKDVVYNYNDDLWECSWCHHEVQEQDVSYLITEEGE